MPLSYTTDISYEHTFNTLTQALFTKYPNPFATHVLSSDTIDRWVDSQGRLHSIRIHLKKGILPKWSRAIVNIRPEAFIVEWSVVELGKSIVDMGIGENDDDGSAQDDSAHDDKRRMVIVTKNLTHKKFMEVEELQTITPITSLNSSSTQSVTSSVANTPPHEKTMIQVSAVISSNFKWPQIARKIEYFGLDRFRKNVLRSSKGLTWVCDHIQQHGHPGRIASLVSSGSRGNVFDRSDDMYHASSPFMDINSNARFNGNGNGGGNGRVSDTSNGGQHVEQQQQQQQQSAKSPQSTQHNKSIWSRTLHATRSIICRPFQLLTYLSSSNRVLDVEEPRR